MIKRKILFVALGIILLCFIAMAFLYYQRWKENRIDDYFPHLTDKKQQDSVKTDKTIKKPFYYEIINDTVFHY